MSTKKQADHGVSRGAQVAAYAGLYDLDLVEVIASGGSECESACRGTSSGAVCLKEVTFDLPYGARLAVALAFLAVVPAIDFARHGARATRWREYAFWVGCGGTGAAFAALVDQITSRVSRKYFVVGKQLADDATFPRELVLFGLRVGVVAGLAVGGALLISNNPKAGVPQLGYRALVRFTKIPLGGALAGAPLAAALSRWDVQGLGASLAQVMSERDVQRFLLVQRVHVGLYVGALVGTAVACAGVRKGRGRKEEARKGERTPAA